MLRTILVITKSGIVLYNKEFDRHMGQPRMIGSLLTAMLELSTKSVGLPVSYMELSDVALSLVEDEADVATCALFHDPSDGPEFGRLVATEILWSFIQDYRELITVHKNYNTKEFVTFNKKIPSIIENVTKRVVQRMQSQRGVISAQLLPEVVEDIELTNPMTIMQGLLEDGSDSVRSIANISGIANAAVDMMGLADDCPVTIIQEDQSTRIETMLLPYATLVLKLDKGIDSSQYREWVEESITLLMKTQAVLDVLRTA